MTGHADEGHTMVRTTITGWGRCIPEGVVTNDDLATVIDTSDEWIATRSGIRQRMVSHVENSDMATVAARHALAAAGMEATDLDYILVATCTPDRFIPAMACHVQAKLGAVNAAATDTNAGCSGFIYGLNLANGLIATGSAYVAANQSPNGALVAILMGITVGLLAGSANGVGVAVFNDHLVDGLDLSRQAVTYAYLVGTLSSAMLLPFVGKFIDKRGVRLSQMLVGGVFTLALLNMSQVNGWVWLAFGFFASRCRKEPE